MLVSFEEKVLAAIAVLLMVAAIVLGVLAMICAVIVFGLGDDSTVSGRTRYMPATPHTPPVGTVPRHPRATGQARPDAGRRSQYGCFRGIPTRVRLGAEADEAVAA